MLASFSVAAVVDTATVVSTIVAIGHRNRVRESLAGCSWRLGAAEHGGIGWWWPQADGLVPACGSDGAGFRYRFELSGAPIKAAGVR